MNAAVIMRPSSSGSAAVAAVADPAEGKTPQPESPQPTVSGADLGTTGAAAVAAASGGGDACARTALGVAAAGVARSGGTAACGAAAGAEAGAEADCAAARCGNDSDSSVHSSAAASSGKRRGAALRRALRVTILPAAHRAAARAARRLRRAPRRAPAGARRHAGGAPRACACGGGALQKAEQPVNGARCSAAAPREARNRFAATSSTPATGLEGAGLLGGASRKCMSDDWPLAAKRPRLRRLRSSNSG